MFNLINIFKLIFFIIRIDTKEDENKMADIKKAMQWMREGKFVTRPSWDEQSYWKLSTDKFQRIVFADNTNAVIHLRQLEATDWKIWEKDLSMTHREVKELIRVMEFATQKNFQIHPENLIKYLKE